MCCGREEGHFGVNFIAKTGETVPTANRSSGPSTIVGTLGASAVTMYSTNYDAIAVPARVDTPSSTATSPRNVTLERIIETGASPRTPSVEGSPRSGEEASPRTLTPRNPIVRHLANLTIEDDDGDEPSVSEHSFRGSHISSTTDTSENEWRERLIGKDVSIPSAERCTQISLLAGLGQAKQLDAMLINLSIDPNIRDYDRDRTPLHWAAARNRINCVKCLLKAQADPTLVDKAGHTPLDYARRLGHGGISMLLALGPPLEDDKRVFEGLEGLSLHAALNHPMRLKQLLKHGSPRKNDPNAKDPDGDRTPLHWASARGATKCIHLLINSNANLHAVDSNGRTPLDLALETRQGEAHTLLMTAGGIIATLD